MNFPADRKQLELAGYVQQKNMSRPCKRCGADLEFWTTPLGKLAPLEVIKYGSAWMLVSHFETCPYAAEFRKNRPAVALDEKKPKQGALW